MSHVPSSLLCCGAADVLVVGYPNVGSDTVPPAAHHITSGASRDTAAAHIKCLLVAAVVSLCVCSKSSIINNLRSLSLRRSGPSTAPIPGYTRHIRGFLVSKSPPLLMLDTPGVMQPSFTRTLHGQHSALKLAMVRAFRDSIVTYQLLARYLLYTLNQHTPTHSPHYHSAVLAGLHRTNDVSELVRWAVGRVDGRVGLVDGAGEVGEIASGSREGESVEERAVQWLLRKFRLGELGQFMLDDVDGEIDRMEVDEREREERLRANRERKKYEESAVGARRVRIITIINDESSNRDKPRE